MDSGDTLQLIILVILLALSAFFSACGTALTSVSKSRLRSLSEEGNERATLAVSLIDAQSSKVLSAIIIGNNIANISITAITVTFAYRMGGYMTAGLTAAAAAAVILIFGEIAPKNYAAIKSEKVLLRHVYVLRVFTAALTPLIFLISLPARAILFLFRVEPAAGQKNLTEEELRTIVDVSHERGVIESGEKELIYNVFDLGDAHAKDIMVPRVHVTFADVENTYEELIEIFREDKFTRLPVYEETQDNIIGIINMKDLLLYDRNESFNIRDIMRKPHFTYEYKSISDLLVEMRESTFNIAIVLDEYGEMAGLITLEDILEELVGEIHDEYDEQEEDTVIKISDLEYIIDGAVNLDDVNDRLHTAFASDDYDSLGGLIIEYLDRLPELNDEVTTEDGIRLVVEKIDKNRVESVHVYLPEKTDTVTDFDGSDRADDDDTYVGTREKSPEPSREKFPAD